MAGLIAPFLASDGGDLTIYESIDDMVAMIEGIDALAGALEFFDANGTMLEPVSVGERWAPMPSSAEPKPERLEEILRSYFDRLPKPLSTYTARAATRTSLPGLAELRQELARDRRAKLGFRRF